MMWSLLMPCDVLPLLWILFSSIAHFLVTLLFLVLSCFIFYQLITFLRSRRTITGLTKRAVFITGCDSGFGRGLAKHLDSLGVPVFAGCLTQKGKTSLQEECSCNLTTITLDVTSTQSIETAFTVVQKSLKRSENGTKLWGVVNNAGIIGDFGTTEMYTKQDFQRVMDVNFFGQVEVVRTFLSLLKESKGRIVNIGSIAGIYSYSTLNFPSPYTPSKFAVVGYTEALRHDLMKWGIEVSLLLPGGHKTDIVSIDGQLKRFRAMWEGLSNTTQQEYGQEWIDQVCDSYSKLDKLIESLPGIEPVVEAYTHALFSQHPKQRYLVGTDAMVMNFIKLLPQCVIDKLVQGPLNMMPIQQPVALKEPATILAAKEKPQKKRKISFVETCASSDISCSAERARMI